MEEDPLHNPAQPVKENESPGSTPPGEEKNFTPITITHPMEVHHHPHHERKKNWKSYFWEFLMLFLAVFCGFLAENWREHYIEHKREKEFIGTLVRDLEKDTASLNDCIRSNARQKDNYDSLWTLLQQPDALQHTAHLYYYFIPTTSYQNFHATKGTIRQLENAGGLRLIRNTAAVDSIVKYYLDVESADGQYSTFARYFDQYHEVAFTVFDYSQIDTLFYDRRKILTSSKSFTLLDTENATRKILFNKLYALWFILDSYNRQLKDLKTKSTATLAFLKKEYDIH